MLAFTLLLLLQQPAPGLPPSPVARITVTPQAPTVEAGDSLRLRAEATDAAGRAVPGARVVWFPGHFGFEGAIDSSGLLRAGYPGRLIVNAIAIVPGARPSQPTEVQVTIVAPPAARIAIAPVGSLVAGQRVRLAADVFAATGDRREDPVRWSSSAPAVAEVGAGGILLAHAPGSARLTARAGAATATLAVSVLPNTVRRLEITGGARQARTGDVLRFSAVARDASGKPVSGVSPSWSLAPGDGQVGSDGSFVAYVPGTFVVTATLGNSSAELTVQVVDRDVRREATTVGRLPLTQLMTTEFWPHPDGRHAYLATMADRVYALDITDPAAPRITDSVMVDARLINDVMTTADGRHAVLTREGASSRRNGIVILSLADPAHPKVLSEYTETVTGGVHSAYVYTQARHGTHVYLTDDATGSLRVIDLNDPANPREVARWQTREAGGRTLHDVDVRDGLAYLSYWNEGLVVLDVGKGIRGGSPANPQLVSQFKYDLDALYRKVEREGGPGFVRGAHTAWRKGNYVFVGDEVFSARPQGIQMPGLPLGKANGRLHVIEVSDYANPREVAWYEPEDGGVHNIWFAGDTLYLGDYQGGLRVVDVSGELRGDLLAQGREMAKVHTGDARGTLPNAAMTWGAFYHNGLVWANDVFSGLWAVRLAPREKAKAPIP
ncbi:MAG TPA: hypothetical protein VGQ69_07790 [Gemmatimonadales bacterium]|jgi:hypothetical protein|nr:hypothetical protein [Gemmatimonadales bacterium]